MSNDLQNLEDNALKLEEKASVAREKSAQAQTDAIESYDRRELEWDRKAFAGYDPQDAETAKREAFAAFERAVVESEIGAAWVEYRKAVVLGQQLASEAQSQAVRLGDSRTIHVPNAGAEDLVSAIANAVQREAGARAGEVMDARMQEREQYASGDTDGS